MEATWQDGLRGRTIIPAVGDYLVYEVASLSFIVVRTGEHEFKAHYNACQHRGRQLVERGGRGARLFRCPYHGWSWSIAGTLKEINLRMGFPRRA